MSRWTCCSNPRYTQLPIIAITANAIMANAIMANAGGADRQRCFAAGMRAPVAKPIEPAALWAALACVYKPAFSHGQSCSPIARGKGTLCDPDMVDAFVDIAQNFRSIAHKYLYPS